MKVNKLISKGLALGFLLNSFSVLSYANTEIPNRYQALEGKYITIKDSTEGNLEEIEIFGNTIQNPNNPEDIQSVGDLYVDNEGNPVLDEQGREQYKIDIISRKKNIFNFEDFKSKSLNEIEFDDEGYLVLNKNNFKTYEVPKNTYDPNKTYVFSAITNKNEHGIEDCIALEFYYTDGSYNQVYIGSWGTSTISNSSKIIDRIIVRYPWSHYGYDAKIKDIQLEESNIKTNFEDYHENKTSIIILEQLYKVDGVSDRLYWDEMNKEYIIEKNIVKFDITNPEEFKLTPFDYSRAWGGGRDTNTHNLIGIGFSGTSLWKDTYNAKFIIKSSHKILPFHSTVFNKGQSNEYCYLVIGVEKGIINNIDNIQNVKDFVINNMSDIFIKKESPEKIKIPTQSKNKIPTYDGKTHIYIDSKNGINPTLKVTVDRIEQVSQEAVNIVSSNPTTYNISLARMLVNQLPESLYKDQLQNQLNELFIEDIVLEKKNATANVDLYIKSENILQMSLNTNSITFEDFSGVEDIIKENAVNISINSSLPYSLNAYLPTEIQNSDKSNTMNKDILNIKENSELEYKTFSNTVDKIVLKDNNPAGNNINHGIGIKLKGNIAHQKDVYKTTIKFEAEQK